MTELLLPAAVLDRICRHAEHTYPEECCGVLIGQGRRVERSVEAANVADGERTRRYAIDSEVLLAVHEEARQRRRDVVGYYHSHPDRPARPSAFDLDHAWPETSYLIVALEDRRVVELRSWRIDPGGDRFEEEPWSTRPDHPAEP